MQSSYKKDEVTLLLKDISGQVEPLENSERERFIQSGVHYSEMLPKEHLPSEAYRQTFMRALDLYAAPTAKAVQCLCDAIIADKGRNVVLVSLARAGTPVGVLLKRYFRQFYQIDVPHYTISIIRGKGIDKNAVEYILARHPKETIQFVDGWTGKGAIQNQLKAAIQDFLIPSSCLNDYQEFESYDLTETFLSAVEKQFGCDYSFGECAAYDERPQEEIHEIAEKYHISDINFIKPGLGEATRVLLRRIPWKILVHSLEDDAYLSHIYQLAREKKVELEVYPFRYYKACGLIRRLADT